MLLRILAVLFISSTTVVHCKLLEYTFNVSYFQGAPDGVYKTRILGINGQFPGPAIEAVVGDVLRVTVVNNIQDGQNVTIHWHGLHQRGNVFEDGVSQITQCPLKAGHTQVYQLHLDQTGTYWYHSHTKSQYTEGLWGVLIIRSPQERYQYQYDGEFVLTLSDWYHRNAEENEQWHLTPEARGIPPYPESGLINGMGRYNCTVAKINGFPCRASIQKRPVFHVLPGKRYRVRVINTSSYSPFRFSIDGHQLNAIEVDGVDTARAVPADVAFMAPGQRYSFLIETAAAVPTTSNARFLIHANLARDYLYLVRGENINPFTDALQPNLTAVLQYGGNRHHEHVPERTERHDFTAVIPPTNLPNPAVVLDHNLLEPADGVHAPTYFDHEIVLLSGFFRDQQNVTRAAFNRTPFKMPQREPLILSVLRNETLPETVLPFYVKYGDVVQIVINNHSGPHPVHLHGHWFWVLGLGKRNDGDYNPRWHPLKFDGAKRDTIMIEQHGYAVIRFVADNPGVWLLHCHIDWHNLSGMALTIIEGEETIKENFITVPEEAKKICADHGIVI